MYPRQAPLDFRVDGQDCSLLKCSGRCEDSIDAWLSQRQQLFLERKRRGGFVAARHRLARYFFRRSKISDLCPGLPVTTWQSDLSFLAGKSGKTLYRWRHSAGMEPRNNKAQPCGLG